MDVDEFIVPARTPTLLPLLQFFEQESIVLRLQAAMFGTSGHVRRPPGLVVYPCDIRNVSAIELLFRQRYLTIVPSALTGIPCDMRNVSAI